tara:strand:- start:10852 stop:11214 length:363 start_codon:yes stop_codon:yes gene_type:complete
MSLKGLNYFKNKHLLENRIKESTNIRKKYPDRIPVIVEKKENSNILDLDKTKFLVPYDLTLTQFIYVLRKRMKLAPEFAIFVFVNNTIPMHSSLMSSLYEDMKDVDGFLYLTYAGESTFG